MTDHITNRDATLAFIKRTPGCTSNEIALATGILHQSVTGVLTDLTAAGAVSRQRKGRNFHYIVGEDKPIDTDAIDAWRQRAIELQDKVDELYAWKQEAIAKHPDLQPVDPLLVQARKIVAGIYRSKPDVDEGALDIADCVEDGLYDHAPAVQAALAALRAVQEA